MARSLLSTLSKNRLRGWLILFFLALAIPSGLLVYQAYDQLKWEAFHRHRLQAEELAVRIDRRYSELIEAEERRAFVDYNFLVVAGDPASNYIERSELSGFPVRSPIPGLIGYFQVDNEGLFKTPLLPDSALVANRYGIQGDELERRQMLANRLRAILGENRLLRTEQRYAAQWRSAQDLAKAKELPSVEIASASVYPGNDGELYPSPEALEEALESPTVSSQSSAEELSGQAAFDRLSEQNVARQAKIAVGADQLSRAKELQLKKDSKAVQQRATVSKKGALVEKRAPRRERSAVPETELSADLQPASPASVQGGAAAQLRIRTFESEIDPFEMSLLDSGHIVLYRKVWRDNQRYIQGALLEQRAFLDGVIKAGFQETALAQMSNLTATYGGELLATYSATDAGRYSAKTSELRGALLLQTSLGSPLNDLDLLFTIQQLPAGPGATVIAWIAIILFLLLSAGFYAIYRLGVGQINLLAQQQDFVSAVSHELKTPLTSIRMYGEMLREGWVSEEKRREYYDYIHEESERLTRLINNVLQLARLTRNALQAQIKSVSAGELMDLINSKIESQVARAGFELNLHCPDDCQERTLEVDPDYFTQIIINLVDNAIKFSAKAERKAIDIECQLQQDATLLFKVRDYGPGVAKSQMKKIFKLFYRTENELTRETVGTGIGLALVNQLAMVMEGSVDLVNMEPGAEFRVSFLSC